MLVFLIAGSALGFAAGFAPGPLLTMVISQTLKHGLKEGVKTACSPMITDLPIIALSAFLMSGISSVKPLLGLISISGGGFLTYLAYENIKTNSFADVVDAENPNSLSKGAVINALNPHPYIFWITVGSPMMLSAYAQGLAHAVLFLFGFYICLVGAKVILAHIVNNSKEFFSGQTYIYLMKILGLALLVFACILFKDGIVLLFY